MTSSLRRRIEVLEQEAPADSLPPEIVGARQYQALNRVAVKRFTLKSSNLRRG